MNLNSLASFRIDYKDFLKGNNAYDKYPEGGVLASTVGMNSFSSPGQVCNAPLLGTTINGSLRKNGVISWGIGSITTGQTIMGVMTQSSLATRIVTFQSNGAVSSYIDDPTATPLTFEIGNVDTVFYNSKFYVTSNQNIVEFDPSTGTSEWKWWTDTKSQSSLTGGIPHPMVVYESIMYIADGRYLHKNDSGTISTQVLDLPVDSIITALTEFNGLIYIATEPFKLSQGLSHGGAMMFTWDGLLESWYEQYFVDYRINSFYVYKNNLLAFNNKYLGVWNGSEMKPLYPVTNQVLKQHVTSNSNSLIWVDGGNIFRYGAPFSQNISKNFYRYIKAGVGELVYTGIISVYDNNLIVTQGGSTTAYNYCISNLDGVDSTGSNVFTFNKREFKKPVKVRGIVIECDAMVSGQKIKAGYINSDGVTVYSNFASGELSGAVADQVGKRIYKLEFYNNEATTLLYPIVTLTGSAKLDSVDYYYEASEDSLNK